jgi:glycosyltransferase involved in cell wall biosynthesis
VLHDYVLHGLAGGITLGRGDKVGYVREMAYCDGLAGSHAAWRIANEREVVNGHSFPLNKRALDLSLGVVVHSDYVRRLVLKAAPQARVAKVNMGIPLPVLSPQHKMLARQALGLDTDCLLFSSFGFITPVKRIEVILLAFKRLLGEFPMARYFLVGQVEPDYELADTIRLLGLEDKVTVTGYVPFDTYQEMMYAADVAINLRYPTAGETSASVLRLLAFGLPAIVSDVGWFAELPDDCCHKVSPDEKEERTVCQKMMLLAGNERLRRDLGKRARDYVLRYHSLSGAANAYIGFIQSLLESLR